MHYSRWQTHGDPLKTLTSRRPPECVVDGCSKKVSGRGLCSTHYDRWRTHGDPAVDTLRKGQPLKVKFEAYLDLTLSVDVCHEWRGTRSTRGYGRLFYGGRRRAAHHVAWYLAEGYWPAYILHSCDNPPCVNRAHLSEGTHFDNMRQARERNRYAHVVPAHGEVNAKKLTRDQARSIYVECHSGVPKAEIAERYGISLSTVYGIGRGEGWRRDTLDLTQAMEVGVK